MRHSTRSLRTIVPATLLVLLAGCGGAGGPGNDTSGLSDANADAGRSKDAHASRDATPARDASGQQDRTSGGDATLTGDASPTFDATFPVDTASEADVGTGTDPGSPADARSEATSRMEGGVDAGEDARNDAGPDAEGAPIGPAPVDLGSAEGYVILAKSAITNVPTSAIVGNLGLSPAAATYITGFSLAQSGAYWTSSQITGQVFAADDTQPTLLTTAIGDMQTAYTDAASRPNPDFVNLDNGAIGGLTLKPGLYRWASSVSIPATVNLWGKSNDTWIFQIAGNLTMNPGARMTLVGGADAANIVWQVAGAVDLETSTHAEGVVLCKTAITLQTSASIHGRLLAQTAVNLASNSVTGP